MSQRTNGRMQVEEMRRTATEPKRPDMTIGELFSEMTSELGDLFRKEVELAKLEGREEAKRAGSVAAMFAVAGVAALLMLMFASAALALLLDEVMHPAWAALIVAVLWTIAAAVAVAVARRRVRDIAVLPQTTRTLKEDVQWARAQTS